MARTKSNGAGGPTTANIGFEAKLWLTADKLRNSMDAAEYKHRAYTRNWVSALGAARIHSAYHKQ